MVATAVTLGIWVAAASTAAPPRLCPISSRGGRWVEPSAAAAATRSSTLEVKLVLAKSPSLEPRPVKSNRRTAETSFDQASADPRGRHDVLGAGEAMGEKREGPGLVLGEVQSAGQLVAAGTGEGEPLGPAHRRRTSSSWRTDGAPSRPRSVA